MTQNRWFLLPYLLILAICSYFLIFYTKSQIHIYVNHYYSSFFDVFFKYITNLGDGIFLPVLLLILLFFKTFRDGLYLVIVFLISGLLVQILKHSLFHSFARPVKYLGESVQLHLISGVEQLYGNSFPSGHSASAFGFYLCMAIVVQNKWMKLSMFVLASLVAFSRVYLSQHFLIDIFAGSIIGTITALACHHWIYTLSGNWLDMNLKTINRRK